MKIEHLRYFITLANSASISKAADRKYDELEADESFEAWWQMHTEAVVKISEDKKSAVLTINDKSIKAQIKTPIDAKFELLFAFL